MTQTQRFGLILFLFGIYGQITYTIYVYTGQTSNPVAEYIPCIGFLLVISGIHWFISEKK